MIFINSIIFYFFIYYFTCHFTLGLRSLLCLPCQNPSISAIYHKNLKCSLIIMPITVAATAFTTFFVHKIHIKFIVLLILLGVTIGLSNYHITTVVKGSYRHRFFIYNSFTLFCFIIFFIIY